MKKRSDLSYSGDSVQVVEPVSLGNERLLEQLVFLLQLLHGLDRVSQVLALEVALLAVEPGLGRLGVLHVLVHLQDELQVLPPVLPIRDQICSLVPNLQKLLLNLEDNTHAKHHAKHHYYLPAQWNEKH